MHFAKKRFLSKRVTSNFIWSVVSEGAAKGVIFFTNIYLARVLGVSNFGLFALAQTITISLWFAVDLGITLYGIREIAKDKENCERIVNPLLTLRIVSGVIVFFIYAIAVFFLEMAFAQRLTFIGCGLYLLTYSFYSDWVFKGLEKFKYIALGSIITSGFFLISVLYMVRDGEDLVVAAISWSSSFLLGSIALIYFLSKTQGVRFRPNFNIRVCFSHIQKSIFFSTSSILWTICRFLPVILLGLFYTPFEVGLFSAPFRIIIAIGVLGFMLPMAFYPLLSELHAKNKTEFAHLQKRLQIIMISIGILVAFIGTLWGHLIITILFGSQYERSVTVFRLLIWFVPLYFLRQTYSVVLLSEGLEKIYNIAALTGVIYISLAGFVLIPRFAIIGGALTTLLSELLILASIVLVYKYKNSIRNLRFSVERNG